MKKEGLLELGRKSLHIITGIVIMILASSFSWINYFLFYLLIAGIVLSLLSLRFKIPLIYTMLKNFERERFLKTFPGKGALFFVAGCLLVLKLFDLQIALASIAILTFVDSVPPLVKITNIKAKRTAGIIAGAICSFLAASIFVPVAVAIIGTIAGIIAEAILLKPNHYEVDDNLIVPLVSGTLMMLFLRYFM